MAMDPGKVMRNMLVGSATLLAIVVMWVMQSKFDGADRKAALNVVQGYRAHTGWTIPEVLDQKHKGFTPMWDVATESSCMQREKVTAEVAGVRYQFMVDINGPSIHPGNKESESVLKQLDEPRPGWPPGSSSASAPVPMGDTPKPPAPPAPGSSAP